MRSLSGFSHCPPILLFWFLSNFCFRKDWESLYCGLFSWGGVLLLCLPCCCRFSWWVHQHTEKGWIIIAIPSPLILCPYLHISQFMCTQGGGRQFSPIYFDISYSDGSYCWGRGAKTTSIFWASSHTTNAFRWTRSWWQSWGMRKPLGTLERELASYNFQNNYQFQRCLGGEQWSFPRPQYCDTMCLI